MAMQPIFVKNDKDGSKMADRQNKPKRQEGDICMDRANIHEEIQNNIRRKYNKNNRMGAGKNSTNPMLVNRTGS
jgi:hypothetical protein